MIGSFPNIFFLYSATAEGSEVLKHVNVPEISNRKCRKYWPEVKTGMMCAGHLDSSDRDACRVRNYVIYLGLGKPNWDIGILTNLSTILGYCRTEFGM